MRSRTIESDIVFEAGTFPNHHWVKRVTKDVNGKFSGYEVYHSGLCGSTRVASIGYTGRVGLERAKAEIAWRLAGIEVVSTNDGSTCIVSGRQRWHAIRSLSVRP